MAHGVTIHRRIVERRQVDRRGNIVRQRATARQCERDRLDFGDRLNPFGDDAFEIGDREQRPGKRETIVGQLRH